MLLDVTAVLLGIGLAAAGFVVVIVVSATVLRLIGFVLGDGEPVPPDERSQTGASPAGEDTASEGEQPGARRPA